MNGRTNIVTPWAPDGAKKYWPKEATVTHLSVEFVRPGREKGVARGGHVFGLRHVYWGELVTWNTCHNDKVIYWQLISLLVYRLLVILQWLLKEKLCWKYSGRTLRDQSHLENLSSSRPGCSLRSPSGRVLRTWSGSSAEFLGCHIVRSEISEKEKPITAAGSQFVTCWSKVGLKKDVIFSEYVCLGSCHIVAN